MLAAACERLPTFVRISQRYSVLAACGRPPVTPVTPATVCWLPVGATVCPLQHPGAAEYCIEAGAFQPVKGSSPAAEDGPRWSLSKIRLKGAWRISPPK